MEYKLIFIIGDGNCLSRSMVYVIFGIQEKHWDIRLRVANLVINNWEIYKEFVIGDILYRLPIYNYNDYKHLMNSDGEYAGHVELECISWLYAHFMCIDIMILLCRLWFRCYIMCNLLFSGPVDAGHYSVLVFGNNMNIQN